MIQRNGLIRWQLRRSMAGSGKLCRKDRMDTGEEIYRNWTIELSRGIVRAGAPEKHSWGFWNCQCQCCGTAGILEHFAAMYEYTGEKEFYDYMIRTYAALTGKKLTNLYGYHFFEKF